LHAIAVSAANPLLQNLLFANMISEQNDKIQEDACL